MLRRAACLVTAGIAAIAFFPGAAQARPYDDRPTTPAGDTFVGEGRGRLSDAEARAERDAYRQARRAGYSRHDCEEQRTQKTPVGDNNWFVRFTIECSEDDDDRPNPGNGGELAARLVNAESGLCFDASNSRPRIEECDGTREQAVEYDRDLNLTVLGRCLGVSGNRVVLSRCDDGNDQRWNSLTSNNRTVLLENRSSGNCLAVLDADLDEGAAVGTRSCDNSDTQEWQVRR
ncbi:hypothetical protein GCM10010123_12760 [Pilimelia anulata]|uniref:Ricin B lectin domain-containing protein n=2 Tax=Pilimelia anulata TaxID=53371 RepID=A0A8J3B5J8_9ACTN|nr:hypothetical protein GCM10010123_12760 [Pilimelia anulata]